VQLRCPAGGQTVSIVSRHLAGYCTSEDVWAVLAAFAGGRLCLQRGCTFLSTNPPCDGFFPQHTVLT
jgi:hypothetical protein